jgi:hypothetical protein
MWQLSPSSYWQKVIKRYEKKHPRELAAVLHNLDRYLNLLNAAPNAKAVQAGYLHPEPLGIVAIDQKGGGENLQQTRLYTFASDPNLVLYLITIGNKQTQKADIDMSKDFVRSLKE